MSEDGFMLLPDVLDGHDCDQLAACLMALPAGRAGCRSLLTQDWCRALAGRLRDHAAIAALLPPDAVAVQCTSFQKSRARNWLVSLHQDLSIPVAERVAHPGLQGWARKDGSLYVQPPLQLLQQLLALRLHVDDCTAAGGPLRVIPGSHRLGRLDDAAVAEAAARARREQAEVVCTAPRGSVLAMRPLLLHASSRATGQGQRRVLHFLFGPPVLPWGLRWQEVL